MVPLDSHDSNSSENSVASRPRELVLHDLDNASSSWRIGLIFDVLTYDNLKNLEIYS